MNKAEDIPECPEGEHHWCWDDHAGNPDSSEVYRLTGVKTAAWGHSWGISGSRICARCGMQEDWESRHSEERYDGPRSEEPTSRWSQPDPELAEKLRDLLP
jgi:hypothetical protein